MIQSICIGLYIGISNKRLMACVLVIDILPDYDYPYQSPSNLLAPPPEFFNLKNEMPYNPPISFDGRFIMNI